ncbi:MAG: HAMP domain-containing protein [Minicystis sp.]
MTRLIRNLSLRTKLVLLVTLLVAAITTFISVTFPARVETLSRHWAERRATTVATVLAGAVAPGLELDDAVTVSELLGRLEPAEGAVYAVVRRADHSIFASFRPETAASVGIKPDGRSGVFFSGDLLHVITPVKGRARGAGTLTVAFSLTELDEEKHNNRAQMTLVALGILLVGVVMSFVFGTYFVEPIRRMTAIAQQLSKGDLSQPAVEVGGRDEVGRMAEAFDAMVTQQQRTGTEQVSKSMNDIAAILGQSVASTKQTRALAEDLKTQAERLAEVVGRFKVSRA